MVGVATEGEADEEANKEHASAVCCSRSFPSGAFCRWQSWDAVIGGGGRPLFFEEVVVEEVEAGEEVAREGEVGEAEKGHAFAVRCSSLFPSGASRRR